MNSRALAAALVAAALVFRSARRRRGRRGDAAARVSDRRHVARQLRRAGARRRSRHLLDADRDRRRIRRCIWSTCRSRASTGSARPATPRPRVRRHYIETQAENDYAALSNDVAPTLNEVAHDRRRRRSGWRSSSARGRRWPTGRRAISTTARPKSGRCSSMLDEAIADLRAARSPGRFDAELSRVHRSAGDCRAAAAAAADAAGGDRAGADGGARRRHQRRAHVAAGDGGRGDRSREGGAAGRLGASRAAETRSGDRRPSARRPLVPDR